MCRNWGCKAVQGVVQPAVHASAGHEMLAKVARKCGEVGRGYMEPESRVVASDRKWSRKLLRGMKLCRGGHQSWEHVRFESLRLRISAARWRMQGMGLTGPQSLKSREGKSILFSEAERTQSAEKWESAGKQGLESVQNMAKSGQVWCQREQDCRGKQRFNDTNIWVLPTALGGTTPMDSATADAPVEAQIGTIEDGGQLLQAQVSSFRQKQKIWKMAEISTTGSAEGRQGWMPEVLDTNDHDDLTFGLSVFFSIFVEQGPNAMSKVQSGTFAVIYELLNAHAEDMDLILQHPPRWPLPVGHKTIFHPLCVSMIEEASVDGNLLVHDDIYLVQLKRTSEDLDKTAVPSFNDQLTNARIRGGQRICRKDVSNWERHEIFQLGFGSFHLTMNLLWCVLETHWGTLNQMGSLTHLFAILHGLILNVWRNECDYPSLRDFARAEPTPGDLLDCARRIVEKYASVEPVFQPINPKAPPKDLVSGAESTKPVVDIVHRNIALLTHDLLLVAELVDAIATGDFGRVKDILPTLTCMFRGSGSNNYLMEILHLIFNIKEVWTPAFADIMRDNMLVNPSGLPRHAMGIDMNIEHLIQYLKTLFVAKGIYSNWDRLGNIAAGINYLQLVKKRVTNLLRSGYCGSTHTDVDTSALVWWIANKANELGLQSVITDCGADLDAHPVVDIFTTGFRKFQTSSLATFNKKLTDTRQGSQSQPEVDEIAPCQVVEDGDTDEPELSEEISELHED
ncbi:hypothetical protein EDB86DRAFT_3245022 [Lactarius hatsudake]|nr:hypothetical protein EDB86DRAFT_3245022 [Lactarius hatsudake]